MNIAAELERKLTGSEFNLVSYYIYKASEAYDEGRYSTAREALQDAVAVAQSHGEYNAANKISYYLKLTS